MLLSLIHNIILIKIRRDGFCNKNVAILKTTFLVFSPFLVWTLKALLVQTRERKEDTIARLLQHKKNGNVVFGLQLRQTSFLTLQSFL